MNLKPVKFIAETSVGMYKPTTKVHLFLVFRYNRLIAMISGAINPVNRKGYIEIKWRIAEQKAIENYQN